LWVIAILASLVILVVAVLCIPLDMAVRLNAHGRPKFSLRLEWLFGLVSQESRGGKKKRAEEKPQQIEGKRKIRKKRANARLIFKILRTKGLLRQLKLLIRGIFSHLRIRELGADFRVGLDNPADTAILFAFIQPANIFLSPPFARQIRLQPSFGEAAFEGYLHGTARMQPIQLVPPLLQFVFSLPAARILKVLVLSKWKSKK
jgi:hypothetical protein